LIAAFFALLFLPLADAVFELDPVPPMDENRTLAEAPGLPTSLDELAAFPARFEASFNDHFGFRNSLLRLHSLATVHAFGVSPTPMVAVGKDGWLFMATEELEYHRADRPFSAQDLDAWQRALESRRDWLAQLGCRLLVVVVPNKSTIYPEHLPASARRLGAKTRLDQLVEHMHGRSDVALLDLRPALLREKGPEALYFKTDSHWNTLGAFVGYQEIVKALGRWFPELEPLPRSSFRVRMRAVGAQDLGKMVGVEGLFPETWFDLERSSARRAAQAPTEMPRGLTHSPRKKTLYATEVADPSLPRGVLFCDSFSTFFLGLLPEHFSRLVRFRSSYAVDPQALFEPALIVKERPQVVICEFAERFLLRPPPAVTVVGDSETPGM